MNRLEKIMKAQEILESNIWTNIPKDKKIVYIRKDNLFLKKYLEDYVEEIIVVEEEKLPPNCEIVIGIKPTPPVYGDYAQEIEIDIDKDLVTGKFE